MNTIFQILTGLELANPWLLALALLLPLVLILRRWRASPSVLFAPSQFLARHTLRPEESPDSRPPRRPWRVRYQPLPQAFQVLGLACLVLALARPQKRHDLPQERLGIDILLCLDVSSSMATRDMDPERTRLDLARAEARAFVAGRPGDRMGLITFARYPDLRCPLTLDHQALGEFLQDISLVQHDGPEDATGIGAALARAGQVLGNAQKDDPVSARPPSQVIILLTDGEENVASTQTPQEIAPLHAAQFLESLGLRVYTIAAGIGNPGPSGMIQPLDTRQVRQVAQRSGGRFFEARDGQAVSQVFASINQLEKMPRVEKQYELVECFVPFLLVALLFLLTGRILQASVLEVLP